MLEKRTDPRGHFSAELEILKRDNVLSLSNCQCSVIANYHKNFIEQLALTFDIDSNSRERPLSLGLKIVSFLGALGFAASVFFLFCQFWGRFSTNIQVFIHITGPLIALIAAMVASKKEKPGYFSKLFGLVGSA